MTAAGMDIEISELCVPKVCACLHRTCFEQPWNEDAFTSLCDGPGVACLTALVNEVPIGFVLTRQVADEAEILTICVVPEMRRQGIACMLLEAQIARMKAVRKLFLEVSESNLPAKQLYDSLGFDQAGLRKAYYDKPGGAKEDALLLKLELSGAEAKVQSAKV